MLPNKKDSANLGWSYSVLTSAGNSIDCFECNSWEDYRCHDPWNWTYPKSTMPPTSPCEGCCVKMVHFIGTEHYHIRRTCTDQLEINFFMVNHGCMTEGHRHGHMCFCEEDECNAGQRLSQSAGVLLLITSLLLRWWTINTTKTIIPQSHHCLADCFIYFINKNYILSNAVIIYFISSIFLYSVVLLGIK